MNILEVNSVHAEEERALASFSWRLIEIAAVAGACPHAALDAMRLPAIALDRRGFIASVNAAADALFDNDIKVKDRQLIVCDPDARVLLKKGIAQLRTQARLHHSFVVRRTGRLPVVVRIWPLDGPAQLSLRLALSGVHAILTATPILDAPWRSYSTGWHEQTASCHFGNLFQ
jgi:hypothetical protein